MPPAPIYLRGDDHLSTCLRKDGHLSSLSTYLGKDGYLSTNLEERITLTVYLSIYPSLYLTTYLFIPPSFLSRRGWPPPPTCLGGDGHLSTFLRKDGPLSSPSTYLGKDGHLSSLSIYLGKDFHLSSLSTHPGKDGNLFTNLKEDEPLHLFCRKIFT